MKNKILSVHTSKTQIHGYDGDCLLYTGITPQADTEELATQSARLILYFHRDGIEFHYARQGELRAGWVIGLVEPAAVAPPLKTFRVATVSSNTNSFGLSGVVLVAQDGEAFEAATNTTGNFVLAVGAEIRLPIVRPSVAGSGRYTFATHDRIFEIPRCLPHCSATVVAEIFSAK